MHQWSVPRKKELPQSPGIQESETVLQTSITKEYFKKIITSNNIRAKRNRVLHRGNNRNNPPINRSIHMGSEI